MKRLRAIHRINLSKKRLLLGVGVGVALLIAIYIYISAQAWQQMSNAASAMEKNTKQYTKVIFTDDTEREDRVQAVSELVQATNRAKTLCNTNWWYEWQSEAFHTLQERKKDCQAVRKTLQTVHTAATVVNGYIDNEVALATILQQATITKKTLTAKTWQSEAIVRTNQTVTELKEFTPQETAFTPVYKRSLTAMQRVQTNWQQVVEANKKEDRAKYEASLDTLDNAYQAIEGVSELSVTTLQTLLDTLQNATDKV